MIPLSSFPVLSERALIKEAMEAMHEMKLGFACIVDSDGVLLGIFTDGDIRRMLLNVQKPFSALFSDDVLDHATHSPIKIRPQEMLKSAVAQMGRCKVWDLPVVDEVGKLCGLLHLHPALSKLLNI
jgi:arabinose-5-phosphate isomerase